MRFDKFGLILGVTICLSACGGSTPFSSNKTPSDNSQVFVNPPLSVPPGYYAPPLAAPASTGPGASSAQIALSNSATSPDVAGGSETPGVNAFLTAAGANNVNPNIRAEIDQTASNQAKANEALMDKLVFGSSPPALPAGMAPTIKRSSPGLLSGIF
jgi:Protein of unknown function (DUF3035)